MAGDLSFKQDNSGLTKKFLLLLFSLSKLKLRPHFQIIMYVMGLSLDYPAFCLSFKRLQFSGFFCNVIRQREYYFLSKIAQLSLIFLWKKSSYTFDIFQPTSLLLETFTKSLSITLKSTIFSLNIYSKKEAKKISLEKISKLTAQWNISAIYVKGKQKNKSFCSMSKKLEEFCGGDFPYRYKSLRLNLKMVRRLCCIGFWYFFFRIYYFKF